MYRILFSSSFFLSRSPSTKLNEWQSEMQPPVSGPKEENARREEKEKKAAYDVLLRTLGLFALSPRRFDHLSLSLFPFEIPPCTEKTRGKLGGKCHGTKKQEMKRNGYAAVGQPPELPTFLILSCCCIRSGMDR